MEHLEENSYWEPERESTVPCSSWMLVDWNDNGRIVACAGMGETVSTDECIGDRLIDAFPYGEEPERLLAQESDRTLFVPFVGTWWFIFPQWYLATGYLLLVRLPMPSGTVLALVKDGMMGELVSDALTWRSAAPAPIEMLGEQCLAAWRAASACLPQTVGEYADGMRGEEALREAHRLLRAISRFTGLRLSQTVTANSWCKACGHVEGEGAVGDLLLYSAVMLMLSSALARSGAKTWTVKPEPGEEGVLFTFRTSSLRRDAAMRDSIELTGCRALAGRNCLIFDSTVLGRSFRGHLCAVRKEFALLGIKDDPDKEISDSIL